MHRDARGILSATFPHPMLTGRDDDVAEGELLDALRELTDCRRRPSYYNKADCGVVLHNL